MFSPVLRNVILSPSNQLLRHEKLLIPSLAASIVNEPEIVVFNGADRSDVPLLHCPPFDLQPDTTAGGDNHLLVIGYPCVSLTIESIEHILWHRML